MAIALTAWLMAPAPIAWTSTRPLLLITPAMAPATATGFEGGGDLTTLTRARPPRPLLLITPAMAPATATGLEEAETFSTSTGARSPVICWNPFMNALYRFVGWMLPGRWNC